MKQFILENKEDMERVHEEMTNDYMGNAKQIVESTRTKFDYEAKYPGLFESFYSSDPQRSLIAAKTIMAMETQRRFMGKLSEATISAKFGDIAPRVMDIMRTSFPNQVAHLLVDVQMMKSTHDVIYIIKPYYDKAKSDITTATEMFGYQSDVENYASEVYSQDIATGDGTLDTFNGTLTYIPRKKRAKIILKTTGEILASDDDGKGTFSAVAGASIVADGTIDYDSKAVVINSTNLANGVILSVKYEVDTEQDPSAIGSTRIEFSTLPVEARKHPLRLSWSVDSALIASSAIGIDVEDNVALVAAQELKSQQDYAVIAQLLNAAGTNQTSLAFDATVPTGIVEVDHAQGLRRKFAHVDSVILNAARRGEASWYVVGTDVESYLTYLDHYKENPNPIPIGVYQTGTYRGRPVFKNPRMTASRWIGGYKGNLFGDAGVVLAKYIELYTTPTLEFDDFIGRKGMASFYDIQTVTKDYYKSGAISGL